MNINEYLEGRFQYNEKLQTASRERLIYIINGLLENENTNIIIDEEELDRLLKEEKP